MAEDYGVKVSLEGYSVLTSTALETAFKNDSSLLKVVATGTGTIGATNVATITHNLGYVPQFLVFGEVYNVYDGTTKLNLATGDIYTYLAAGSSTTELKIVGLDGSDYQYYIFYETIDGAAYSATTSANNYGIKVMKPTKSITSTYLEDQSFNSEKTCLKIAKQGTYSGTAADSSNHTVTIAHGLSYTPGFLMWFQTNNDGKYYLGTTGDGIYWTMVDSTNISFTYDGITGGTSIKLYYILFVETAA